MTRVLVIDDEAPIRLLCRVNLEAENMDVLEASDGPTGLEKARNEECGSIQLDSATHRGDAHRFYFRERYRITSFHFGRYFGDGARPTPKPPKAPR